MDELRGPIIQIVLHVKEGLGFGFLKSPVIVTGSLNGYILETDPTVPTHAPSFDAELVWEADKRRFRSLRVQNVPVKIEVYTTSTQGKKDKVGYLLLSLLGAQPCPTNKMIEVKHSWHKLLGVKSEGKCCHPQLLMSLSVEDRVNPLTPRNDLRMFNSKEAYPTALSISDVTGNVPLALNLQESKRSVSHPDLKPRLLNEEGLIQIGDGQDMFILSIFMGTVENIDLLLPLDANDKEPECYITYSIFTHTIRTDSVRARGARARVQQRSSVRMRGAMRGVARAVRDARALHAALCATHTLGIFSMDLTKLVPTDDIRTFTRNFCTNNVLTIHERCFFVRCDDVVIEDARRPFVDVELSLKYLGVNLEKPLLTTRSATQLKIDKDKEVPDFKSESCANLDQDVGGMAYTNPGPANTARNKNASGDAMLQSNEIAELIRKMYDSFTLSQEKLLAQLKPYTSDMQVQCEQDIVCGEETSNIEREPVKLETNKSETYIKNKEKDMIDKVLAPSDRDELMKKYVEELEDWKERQQQLFNCQLKRKEEHHLSLLSASWSSRRSELESRLSRGVERCGRLAEDLAAAAEELRLRGHTNTQRERRLLEAKKGLEAHYTSKYQELREASQKMEDDMNHRLKLKDMQVEELQHRIQLLEKQNDVLKNNLKNSEKETENKNSGLTKDQTASLIQELRYLEEKLDSAVQSKSFFKEQWGRAVRELHCLKINTRRQMLHTLRTERRRLGETLDPIEDEELMNSQSQVDINRLKDDFYVDILANTPALESHSIISRDGMELYDDLKNLTKHSCNDKLGTLITQRDQLIQQQSPDEERLKQLNHEIRNILVNCNS